MPGLSELDLPSKRTPPPGARRNTFGAKPESSAILLSGRSWFSSPLYIPDMPSSRASLRSAGNVHSPVPCSCILVLTTSTDHCELAERNEHHYPAYKAYSEQFLRIHPQYRREGYYLFHPSSTRHIQLDVALSTYCSFRQYILDSKDSSKIPSIPETMSAGQPYSLLPKGKTHLQKVASIP